MRDLSESFPSSWKQNCKMVILISCTTQFQVHDSQLRTACSVTIKYIKCENLNLISTQNSSVNDTKCHISVLNHKLKGKMVPRFGTSTPYIRQPSKFIRTFSRIFGNIYADFVEFCSEVQVIWIWKSHSFNSENVGWYNVFQQVRKFFIQINSVIVYPIVDNKINSIWP